MRDDVGTGGWLDRGEIEIALARFALMLARPVDVMGAPDTASIAQAAQALAARVDPAERTAVLDRLRRISLSLAGVDIDAEAVAQRHAAGRMPRDAHGDVEQRRAMRG